MVLWVCGLADRGVQLGSQGRLGGGRTSCFVSFGIYDKLDDGPRLDVGDRRVI